MSSRHSYFHSGSLGRLSSPTFDHSRPNGSTRQAYDRPTRNIPSSQSDSSISPPTTPICRTPPQNASLLERHAISTYPTKTTQLPLSVYELPTATYMWARWDPKDEEQPARDPVIFVKYRPAQCDSESSSGYSRPPSRSSVMTSSSRPSPVSTPPPARSSRKRSSSAESDDECASPSDRFLKHPRFSQPVAPNRVLSARSASPERRPAPLLPTYPLRAIYREPPRAAQESDYSDVDMPPPQSAHQSNSTRGGATLARTLVAALSQDREDDPRKTEWTKYTYPAPETSAGPDFECTWEVKQRDGSSKPCGYSSKKHLVKRHIESKHLQLRPCVCHFCGKGFSQKSNLDTHLNTHTGEAPHKCHYCNDRFKDPARRHRHMIQTHNHQSSRTKKGRVFPECGNASSAETSDPDAEECSTGLATPPPR